MQDPNNMLLKGEKVDGQPVTRIYYPDALMRNKIIPGSQSLTSKKLLHG